MSFEAVANTIRTRFRTEVAGDLSLPTQYDNAPFSKSENVKWCRFTVKPGQSAQIGCTGPNSRPYRTVGVCIAQLFGPVDKGDKDLWEIADSVIAAFRGESVSGVVFGDYNVNNIGRVDNEWQMNVTFEYRVDDHG